MHCCHGIQTALGRDSGATIAPRQAEALAISPGRIGTRDLLVASGATRTTFHADELADAVGLAERPDGAAAKPDPTQFSPLVESPANKIRSVMRMFVSDVEDKAWYNDRAFWTEYLDLLAAQRFNRFNLALGLGYDGPTGVRDSYFYFAIPFCPCPATRSPPPICRTRAQQSPTMPQAQWRQTPLAWSFQLRSLDSCLQAQLTCSSLIPIHGSDR